MSEAERLIEPHLSVANWPFDLGYNSQTWIKYLVLTKHRSKRGQRVLSQQKAIFNTAKKSNNDSDIERSRLFCWLAYSSSSSHLLAGRGFFTQQTIILSVSEENSEQKTCLDVTCLLSSNNRLQWGTVRFKLARNLSHITCPKPC